MKIEDLIQDFLTTPSPQKNLKMTVHLCFFLKTLHVSII